MSDFVPPIQPARIRVRMLDGNGLPTPDWVRWFNDVMTTSQVVATNTTSIVTNTAGILAGAMFTAMLDLPRNWTPDLDELRAWLAAIPAGRDYTPELDELRNRQAPIETPRDYTRELDELRAITLDPVRDFTPALDELRALLSSLDPGRDLSAIDELRGWLASVDPLRDFTRELDELRALYASLDVNAASIAAALVAAAALTLPLSIANGGTGAATAAAARTSLGLGTAATQALSAWASWTPTMTGNASMTVASVVVNDAQSITIGGAVSFKLNVACTLGGTASFSVSLTLPVAAVGVNSLVTAVVYQGTFVVGFGYINVAAGTLVISPNAGANFALGSVTVEASGTYRIT